MTIDEKGGSSRASALARSSIARPSGFAGSNGQITLDYGRGLLAINAPKAQAAAGALAKVPRISLADMEVQSGLDLGVVIAVALDDQPLATSSRSFFRSCRKRRTTVLNTVEQDDVKADRFDRA